MSEPPAVDEGLTRGVARGVAEPELLLEPELLPLSELLLSPALFLPLELLGLLGGDILADFGGGIRFCLYENEVFSSRMMCSLG